MSGFWQELLRIPRVCDGLSLLCVVQTDVSQNSIGNVAHENPADLEDSFPFIRSPDGTASSIIHGSKHLGHATEVATGVDAKKKVDWAAPSTLFECLVQPLISRIGRAPDLVFERLVDIILGIRLDNKVSGIRRSGVKRGRIVALLSDHRWDVDR